MILVENHNFQWYTSHEIPSHTNKPHEIPLKSIKYYNTSDISPFDDNAPKVRWKLAKPWLKSTSTWGCALGGARAWILPVCLQLRSRKTHLNELCLVDLCWSVGQVASCDVSAGSLCFGKHGCFHWKLSSWEAVEPPRFYIICIAILWGCCDAHFFV